MDFKCNYCGRECKNINSLRQHETRCKLNPLHIQCYGNKGNMPKHIGGFLKKYVKMSNGDILNITNQELEEYQNTHKECEICHRKLEECVKWNSKYAPKRFCIDHDHNTNKFRGLLCSNCNRQLGWYETQKDNIENYLRKS